MGSQSERRVLTIRTLRLDSLRVYTGLISFGGVCLLLWAVPGIANLSLEVYSFIALALLAELTTTEALAPQLAFNISSAVYLATLLLFGVRPATLSAMLGGIVATLVIEVARRAQGRPTQVSILQRTMFNMSSLGLAMLVAGRAFEAFGGRVGVVVQLSTAGPMVVAAFCMEMINAVIVVKAVALQTKMSALQVWRQNIAWALPIHLLTMLIGGGCLALGYQVADWLAIAVFFLPIALTIYSFRPYIRETRAQMAHLEEMVAKRTLDLQQSNDELRQLDRLKMRFFSVVNHEMRNPLHSILGYTELLLLNQDLSPDQRSMLKAISQGGERLLDLVNNILDMSRLEDGRLTIVPQSLAVRTIIDRAVSELRPAAERKHITVTVEVPENLPHVMADPKRALQVLLNLLRNAISYTPETGEVTVSARHLEAETMVEIAVADTGIGIPADQLPEVLTLGRVERAGAQQTIGTGLGLYIANGLVKAHGGTMSVTSEEDRGSRFAFTLPLALSNTAPTLPPVS